MNELNLRVGQKIKLIDTYSTNTENGTILGIYKRIRRGEEIRMYHVRYGIWPFRVTQLMDEDYLRSRMLEEL